MPYNKACREFILRNTHVQQLVLLPHTVQEQSDVLRQIVPNMILFARERRSFRHLTRHMRYPENARIDHDLAFAIGRSTIQSLIKNDLGPGSGCLHAFRTDREATEIEIPPNNRDLSNILKTACNTRTLEGITKSSRAMLEAVAPFAEIKTNRLHIAIAAALLSKKTFLHKNSYFKNTAIYRYSLKPHFPNVKFQDR